MNKEQTQNKNSMLVEYPDLEAIYFADSARIKEAYRINKGIFENT